MMVSDRMINCDHMVTMGMGDAKFVSPFLLKRLYDVCLASDFFMAMPAIEFIGIENVKISRFIEKYK